MNPGWIPPRQIERLRAIPPHDVLTRCGARPDPRDKAKWHTSQGTLSVNGIKFMNWSGGTGGGGAIDLAIHLLGLTFLDAVHWLLENFPQATLFSLPPNPRRSRTAASRPSKPFPQKAARNLDRVRRYLSQERRLPLETIDPFIEAGTVYADARSNAVFLLLGKENQPVGAELRGTGPSPWHALAPGSRRDLGYFSAGPSEPEAIILCESAIDALSCFTLHPRSLCISTAGARANPTWLPALLPLDLPLFCGFDADPTGDHFAHVMIRLFPSIQRLRPSRHDWNDMLP